MSTRKCTRRAVFCRVYLLKHAHEWLSRETLEYCSANYSVLCYLHVLYIERERDRAQALTQLWGSTPDLVTQALMD